PQTLASQDVTKGDHSAKAAPKWQNGRMARGERPIGTWLLTESSPRRQRAGRNGLDASVVLYRLRPPPHRAHNTDCRLDPPTAPRLLRRPHKPMTPRRPTGQLGPRGDHAPGCPIPADLRQICPVCTVGNQGTLDHPTQTASEPAYIPSADELKPGQVLASFEI